MDYSTQIQESIAMDGISNKKTFKIKKPKQTKKNFHKMKVLIN